MAANPRLLHLSLIAGSRSHEFKLAGMRRYRSMRGWVNCKSNGAP